MFKILERWLVKQFKQQQAAHVAQEKEAARERFSRLTVSDLHAPKFKLGQLVRHVKTGHLYKIIVTSGVIEKTLELAYVYVEANPDVYDVNAYALWVRSRAEMEDGRFELVES